MEEARSDLEERVHDLEDSYDRTSEAFKRLIRYMSRTEVKSVDGQSIDSPQLKKINKEYGNIFQNRNERLEQFKSYLNDLDEETFDSVEYLNRLRGIHNEIRALSDYRNQHTQVWTNSYKRTIYNECDLTSEETLMIQKELQRSRKS